MLIASSKRFIQAPFDSEEELERVVVDNYEHIFGPSAIYLPRALIRTPGGYGTIPDGFAFDLPRGNGSLLRRSLPSTIYGITSHLRWQNRSLPPQSWRQNEILLIE